MTQPVKIRAIIIDDEIHAQENLKFLIEEYCPEVEVVGCAGGVNDGLELFSRTHPDLIFLDIRMPSGMEGFDLLEELGDAQFQVVFVTAFKEYAIQAFENRALHYILKPIEEEDLKEAVRRSLELKKVHLEDPNLAAQYRENLKNLEEEVQRGGKPRRIKVHHSKGIKILNPDDISHIRGNGNCSIIHFNNKEEYLDTRTLKVYEALLPPNFFRSHKSFLVNLNEIVEILHGEENGVVLKNGERLSVSRDRKKELLEKINQL
jgi:two-component system LytT family response regulator